MDPLLIVFIGVLTAAVVAQSFLFFGIYRSVRSMRGWMDNLGKDLGYLG